MLDLVIRGVRVIDPSQNIDTVLDVGFADGCVALLRDRIGETAAQTVDAAESILSPGFIDMHAHVYWGATSISIDGGAVAERGGVTTTVDAGSAGAGNFPGFKAHIIERTDRRILAYVNVAYPGIFAYSDTVMVGECSDPYLLDLAKCVATINANRDIVVGVKARVGRIASARSGTAPVEMALQVAEETGLPLMVHIDYPTPSRRQVLHLLRKGDILTHCLRPFPNAALRPNGELHEDIVDARARGVLFDLGHGASSFTFAMARGAMKAGFVPDAISTDVHVLNVDGPVYDLATTMSKFIALGLPLSDVISRVTNRPAAALGRPGLGTLKPGSLADATLFTLFKHPQRYVDCAGEVIECAGGIDVTGTVRLGVWHPREAA